MKLKYSEICFMKSNIESNATTLIKLNNLNELNAYF